MMERIDSLLATQGASERLALGGMGVIMVLIALLLGSRMILREYHWFAVSQLQGRHYRRRS